MLLQYNKTIKKKNKTKNCVKPTLLIYAKETTKHQ